MAAQQTYDPEYTYFVRKLGITEILAEAGVTPATASRNTYVYINAHTGKWDAMELSHREAEPVDDFGRGGFRLGSLDGGWKQYLRD